MCNHILLPLEYIHMRFALRNVNDLKYIGIRDFEAIEQALICLKRTDIITIIGPQTDYVCIARIFKYSTSANIHDNLDLFKLDHFTKH